MAQQLAAWLFEPTGSWIAFVGLAIFTRLPFLQRAFVNVDEGAHMVGARELLRGGGSLYQTFADNKPPLIYFFYALANRVIGASVADARIFAVLTVLPLTALALAWGLRWGARGFLAGALYLLSSACMLAADSHAIHCEHLMLLPLSLLVGLSARERNPRQHQLFFQGVLIGVATLAKQPAALFLGVPLLLVLTRQTKPSMRVLRVLSLLFGFGVTLALSYLAFRVAGTGDAYLYWVFFYNVHHIANPVAPLDALVRGVLALLLVAPCVAPMLWALFRSSTVREDQLESLSWILAALLPAALGMRFFGHYFLPLAWVLSWLAAKHIHLKQDALPALAFGLSSVLAFAWVNMTVFDPAKGIAEMADPRFARLADAVRSEERCSGDASIFVWGYAAPVYVLANTRPASRFVVPIDTISGFIAGNSHQAIPTAASGSTTPVREEHWQWLMRDLHDAQPAVVIDTAPSDLNGWGPFSMASFPRLATFVDEHYIREREVDGSVIYRHRRCYAGAVHAESQRSAESRMMNAEDTSRSARALAHSVSQRSHGSRSST